MSFISASTAAYFSLPMVSAATISIKAAPVAPLRAAILPPPGAGESEPVSLINASTDKAFNSMCFLPIKFSMHEFLQADFRINR